ncbi:MAG: hypothetical protein ACUVQK_14175, partial [Thermogutta sp.]
MRYWNRTSIDHASRNKGIGAQSHGYFPRPCFGKTFWMNVFRGVFIFLAWTGAAGRCMEFGTPA